MANENKMGYLPIKKLILQMSLPPMCSMFLQYSYNLVDSMFVANINENALAAVSLSFPITTLMISLSIWIGVGINVLIAGYLGEKEQDLADCATTLGLLVALIVGICINILALSIMKPYFSAFTNNPAIFDYAMQYMSVCAFMQLDINKIISQMDEYAQEMKNEQVIETVKKAFQKELIVIDALATTKKETIAQVSKLLLEQGCLSEDVTEKVFELEERRPTTIGSQIAMAHVYKDSVKKSGIAVMRMKYPVKWSRSSKVKLVFFLAINMEESNEILKLFKYLYALIDNKEDIQKILEANSSGEIYELLMEEFH